MAQGYSALVPEDLSGMHRELAELVGVDNMVKLCTQYGGGTIWVPTLYSLKFAVRNKDIVVMKAAGRKLANIALKYNISKEEVRYVLRKARVNHEG